MCENNKEILEDFLTTVQESLEANDNKKELATLNRKLQQLETKIKKASRLTYRWSNRQRYL